jgi:exosome complex component RRP41
LALADAGIPLRELVAACAAGKIDGKVVLDLSDAEDKKGDADLPVAYMPKSNSIGLLQMDGSMTEEELKQALEMAVNACRTIYEMQRDALRRKYHIEREESASEEIAEVKA